MSWMIFF